MSNVYVHFSQISFPARYSVVNFRLESHSLRFREVISIIQVIAKLVIPPSEGLHISQCTASKTTKKLCFTISCQVFTMSHPQLHCQAFSGLSFPLRFMQFRACCPQDYCSHGIAETDVSKQAHISKETFQGRF